MAIESNTKEMLAVVTDAGATYRRNSLSIALRLRKFESIVYLTEVHNFDWRDVAPDVVAQAREKSAIAAYLDGR